ncbi:unnamed protein product [Arabidopsis lyrata]|uniref:Predicted protein n=1 Tax=Arabidopsis lyrata subsp. lyrata TaxID=81972 RepID=D7LDY4_ARALL|nr:predicted protein [Arabidopsis lyrata subsp. lyrata]CAH8266145.1 unnamed protein product [Arabidopsis lyrata]
MFLLEISYRENRRSRDHQADRCESDKVTDKSRRNCNSKDVSCLINQNDSKSGLSNLTRAKDLATVQELLWMQHMRLTLALATVATENEDFVA